MALDRTWYNTLVDDTGDGLSGSVWDKADVDALMDAVDAEIARVDRYIEGTWLPVLQGSGGGSPIYAHRAGNYIKIGRKLSFSGRVVLSSVGSLAGALSIGGLPITPDGDHAVAVGYYAGLAAPGLSGLYMFISNGNANVNIYASGAGLAVGGLGVSNIGNSFDIIFSGQLRGLA